MIKKHEYEHHVHFQEDGSVNVRTVLRLSSEAQFQEGNLVNEEAIRESNIRLIHQRMYGEIREGLAKVEAYLNDRHLLNEARGEVHALLRKIMR